MPALGQADFWDFSVEIRGLSRFVKDNEENYSHMKKHVFI
jgi:hypothetical protein